MPYSGTMFDWVIFDPQIFDCGQDMGGSVSQTQRRRRVEQRANQERREFVQLIKRRLQARN